MKRFLMLISITMFSLCMIHAEDDDRSLTKRGLEYYKAGDYEMAENCFMEAIEYRYNNYTNPFSGPNYGLYHIYLGNLYHAKGDYKNAEVFLITGKGWIKNSTEANNYETNNYYAWAASCLGNLYFHMGDYDKAETNYRESLIIFTNVYGEKCEEVVSLLTDIGNIFCRKGDVTNAKKFYLQALDIYKELVDDYASMEAEILNNIGITYYNAQEFSQAKEFYLKALHIYDSIPGNHQQIYATLYCDLGAVYHYLGDLQQAEHYLLEAEKLREHIKHGNPMYHVLLEDLADLYITLHEYTKAENYIRPLTQNSKDRFLETMTFMSETQRSAYWNTVHKLHNNYIPRLCLQSYASKPPISISAYDNELFVKGLLLTSSLTVTNSILESGDSLLIRRWNDLKNRKQKIMALTEKDPESEDLALLKKYAESLEKAITRNSAAYRENMRQWNITWDSVRSVLKPNQVAIEYMRAPLNKDSTMYCALLLRDTCTYPIMIPLFEEKQVAQLLHTSRGNSVQINTTYQFEQHGEKLTQLIWGPLQSYIHEGEEIFISPTHMLHQIAFEHLPYDEHRVMSDVYNIVRLSSTRELVIPEQPIPHKKAVLYGGITYTGLEDEVMAYNKELYAKRSMNASEDSRCALTNYYATPLVGTQNEVDAIVPILKSKQIAVTIYSQSEACEESVKALSGQQQNILHFATHGMYVDTLTTSDPLERCMLTFAGANRALMGDTVPEGTDDGILTAKEISVLDFREADIVVMSACETGLGDVSGEGVFGLQRAFKMAGAQTILMSLWQVHDDATQMLMTAVYRYYSKGLSKREAFRKAQQEVRNYTKTHTETFTIEPTQQEIMENQGKIVPSKTVTKTIVEHPYQSPYFWAGFILLD